MTDNPVKGLKDVLDVLSQLGPKIESQAVRAGLTAAAAVVRDEARARVSRKSGITASAITSGSPRKHENGDYSISVRLQGGRKDAKGWSHAFLGYFLEYGVHAHIIRARNSEHFAASIPQINKAAKRGKIDIEKGKRKGSLRIGGKWVGHVVYHPGFGPKPFLRPALEAKADEAIAAFRARLVAVVEGKTGLNLEAAAEGMRDAE